MNEVAAQPYLSDDFFTVEARCCFLALESKTGLMLAKAAALRGGEWLQNEYLAGTAHRRRRADPTI